MEDFSHLEGDEKLKAENDFLKMKLMLEHGAKFGGEETSNLPADIENRFLNYISAFEKQAAERKVITVFDRIEKPSHFKPVYEIPDEQIETELNALFEYLWKYKIRLDVCSPNISQRELYRFTVEELFEHEMDDMDVPGMITTFIYDEFHPDLEYDNTRIATEDCIRLILEKEPLEWTPHFGNEKLRLNGHYPLNIEAFKTLVNHYKSAYETLEVKSITVSGCEINEKSCVVTGMYEVTAVAASETILLTGNWKVVFELDDFMYWQIGEVMISGINF